MRRAEREIQSFEGIVDVLGRCDTVRLAMFDETYPYVVPLSFGYEVKNGKLTLYIHGANAGKKHELLKRNNRVCVEADLCHRFVDTGTSVSCIYESVIGFGTAERITGKEACHGLDRLLKHCGFDGYPFDPAVTDMLDVYRITLDTVTGKRRSE